MLAAVDAVQPYGVACHREAGDLQQALVREREALQHADTHDIQHPEVVARGIERLAAAYALAQALGLTEWNDGAGPALDGRGRVHDRRGGGDRVKGTQGGGGHVLLHVMSFRTTRRA